MILDGRKTAQKLYAHFKEEVYKLKEKKIIPGLAVVLAGNDPASQIYVKNKKKACEAVGIRSFIYHLPCPAQTEISSCIKRLNANEDVHGILLQLPLPEGLIEAPLIESILPEKDVDGFTSANLGKLMMHHAKLLPCTPAGILYLMDDYHISLSGKHCVVIGRSNIVGKPLSLLLLERDATVTICHRYTENLAEITRQADVLISAAGKPEFIDKNMVKKGAVAVDVGINRVNGRLCGDLLFESVAAQAFAITPVPGGIGPMTVAMLIKNTIEAAKMQLNL